MEVIRYLPAEQQPQQSPKDDDNLGKEQRVGQTEQVGSKSEQDLAAEKTGKEVTGKEVTGREVTGREVADN